LLILAIAILKNGMGLIAGQFFASTIRIAIYAKSKNKNHKKSR